MAQDGGADPHSIAAAHGFLDRCQRRLTSSCILEVPARFERAITDLQSAALTNLAMGPCGTAPRFRSSSSRVKAVCAPITPVRQLALPNRSPAERVRFGRGRRRLRMCSFCGTFANRGNGTEQTSSDVVTPAGLEPGISGLRVLRPGRLD